MTRQTVGPWVQVAALDDVADLAVTARPPTGRAGVAVPQEAATAGRSLPCVAPVGRDDLETVTPAFAADWIPCLTSSKRFGSSGCHDGAR